MDFIEVLAEEIVVRVAPKVAEAVIGDIAEQLREGIIFRYSEEEAAQKLGISPAALAQIRRAEQIEFTYSILPTLGSDGKLHNGRISYLPEHLTDYLKRNEQKYFFGNLRAA